MNTIHEGPQNEPAPLENEPRFTDIADAAPVLIWMSDAANGCTYVSRRWLDFTGRSQVDAFGDGWMASIHPDDLQPHLAAYSAACDAHVPFEQEFRLRRGDGEYRWMLNHAVPRWSAHGNFLGFIGSCLDITQRKLDELALKESRDQITHLSRVASLGALSSALAHELNQPLGVILSNAQAALRFLEKSPPSLSEVADSLRDIVAADQRAADVIQRMRLLLQRGRTEFSPIDVNEIVGEVIALLRSELLHRATTLDFVAASDLAEPLGDGVPLQQVVINLILNAVDAMQHLPSTSRRILVCTKPWGETGIEIRISDQGTGLAGDTLARMFDPFFSTKPNGLGIGLPICRSIIDAHGGGLWAENNPGGGATFHVVLPLPKHAANASPHRCPSRDTPEKKRAETAQKFAVL